MASKKILLGVGLLAAMAILVYAVAGWPPVAKNDTQGTIGVAKKYQAEQISDQDVVLADPDIQSFLQTDFFYQLVTDADFQKLYLNGVLEKAMVQVPGAFGDHVASPTDVGRALTDSHITQNIAAGKFDVAAGLAAQKGIKVTPEDLQKFDMQALGAKGDDMAALGRLLQKDAFQKAIPYSGSMQKLIAQSGTFKSAVQSGDMNKFAQDIVGAKKKAP